MSYTSFIQQFITQTNKRSSVILLHVLGITFFVGQEVLLMYALGMPPTTRGYMAFALEIGIFYANLLWIVPFAYAHKQGAAFVLRLLLVVIGYFFLRSLLAYTPTSKNGFIDFAVTMNNMLFTIWRLNYLLGFGFLLGFYKAATRYQQQQQQMQLELAHTKAEKARIESIMAQMQLSPHLLLGGLYYLQVNATGSAPSVSGAIKILAEIVRYSLIDIRTTVKVPLKLEIEQIENRITYQQYIYDRPLYIQLIRSNDDGLAMQIPPCILITIADNVLKYGLLNDANNPAIIHITHTGTQLELNTWNIKAGHAHTGQGMGLAHIRHVLDHYYANRYSLNIRESENDYALSLTINT